MRYYRDEWKKIAEMIPSKTVKEIQAYSEAFFIVGETDFKLRIKHS